MFHAAIVELVSYVMDSLTAALAYAAKLAALHPGDESLPLVRGEYESGAGRVLGVADGDDAGQVAGDLDAGGPVGAVGAGAPLGAAQIVSAHFRASLPGLALCSGLVI